MKRRLSLILAIGILANTIAPVYAANPPPTINITVPGETKTDVSATMAATKFNVTVPTGLPVNIDETGLITVSDGAAIINNATAPVLVDNVSVTPINTWSLTDYNTDYTKVKVDDKRLAFQLNNDNVKPDGTVDLSIQHWAPIQGKETRPLIYNAKLAFQSKTFQQDIANVIFTIKFNEVSSISITEPEPIKYEFTPNDTRTLQVQFDNLIASDSNVTWSTSDANVATVEAFQQRSRGITQSGVKLCKVTAKAIGTAIITCTLPDGTSKGFDITVSGKAITDLTVSGQPVKTDYIEGTNFDPTGLEITATYNNGTTAIVTGYTLLGGDKLTLGTTGVVVSHSGHQVTVPITVTSRSVTGLTLAGPTNTECTEGVQYVPTGLTVTANYDNGTKEIISAGEYELSGANTIKIGSNTITVSYSSASATFIITGIAKQLTSIKAKAGTATKTAYTEGNNFDPTGVIVTATYNNGTQAEITDYTILDGTALKLGQTTVTLKKLSCEDTIAITVVPKTLNAALQIISLPTKTTGYISEQNLDPQGLIVQANYNNGTSEIISGYVLSGDKALVAGNNTITITYKGAIATFTIQATAKAIKAFGISKQPTKTEYIEGENFELAGAELTLTYNDNTTEKILAGALATSDGQALKLDQATVQIIYNNKYGSVAVNVPVTIKAKSFFEFDRATGTITGVLPGYPSDLVIPESIDGVPVTTIGYYAFYRCTSLTSITLPNSLSTICDYAFDGCKSLTSITIPNSLSTLGDSAFRYCTSLTSITIPNSLTTLGNSAFEGCTSLTNITLPNSLSTLGSGAFYACTNLVNIYINKPENSITGAPWGAPASPKITWQTDSKYFKFDSTTGTITNYRAELPDAPTKVTVPVSINGAAVTAIGDDAFSHCDKMTSITLPDSIATIGDCAFEGCIRLTRITIPSSVTTIGTDAFNQCNRLVNLYINKPTNSLSGSPWGAPARTKIAWRSDPKYFTFDSVDGSITKFNKGITGAPTEIIIPSEIGGVPVRAVGEYAFKDCTNITSVTVPNTVTNIDTCAFYGCTGISNITLPDSVTSLGPNSLNSCTSLTSLVLPKKLVTIGAGAFSNCPGLTTIDIPNKVNTIGDSTFYQCSGLASITIPSSVTAIGTGIFDSCPSLTNVYINKTTNSLSGSPWKAPASAKISWQTDPKYFNFAPATGAITKFNKELPGAPTVVMVPDSINGIPVKYIGGWAFNECTGITSITMPDSITEISERAFNGCSNISGIKLPESLKTIGKWAFYCCNNITSFEIPKNVTEIAEGALRSSPNLSSFTSKSPEYRVEGDRYLIKNNTNELVAFAQYSLNNIIMPESITKIGGSTLYYCADLTGITLPSKLTSIGNNAFDGCMSLANITIPSTVTAIGTGAFATCNKLSTITIEKPTNSITGAPWSAPSSTKIAWQTPSRSFEATGGTITAYNPGLAVNPTSINIPSIINNTPVSVIGPGVFKGLSTIATVTLPDTLTTISDGAFRECTSLTSISIPNSVTSVEKFAFYGCNKLETARLPQGISKISEYTFGGCTKLRQINRPNGIKVIEPNAFHSCVSLPSINLPNQLVTLGAGALNNCASLTAIVLPETLQTISTYTFYNCISLTQITIPRSVTTVGEHSFEQCNKLSTISIQKPTNSLSGVPWGAPWNTKILWGAHPRYFNFSTGIITKFNQGIAEAPKQVIIPQSINGVTVTKIGKGAFQNCPDITEIVMPDSITTIGDSGFEGCINLDSVKLSKNLTAIGHCAFYKCEKLTNIELPNKLPKIGSSAFNSCLKLSNITIPNSVTEIAFYAFANCPSLTSITLPNSITTIGVGPFEYCHNLANIYIAKPINSIQGAPWGAPSNSIVHWDQV